MSCCGRVAYCSHGHDRYHRAIQRHSSSVCLPPLFHPNRCLFFEYDTLIKWTLISSILDAWMLSLSTSLNNRHSVDLVCGLTRMTTNSLLNHHLQASTLRNPRKQDDFQASCLRFDHRIWLSIPVLSPRGHWYFHFRRAPVRETQINQYFYQNLRIPHLTCGPKRASGKGSASVLSSTSYARSYGQSLDDHSKLRTYGRIYTTWTLSQLVL